MIENVRFFAAPALSVVLGGISLASISLVTSIVAGILGIAFTAVKMYCFLKDRKNKQ